MLEFNERQVKGQSSEVTGMFSFVSFFQICTWESIRRVPSYSCGGGYKSIYGECAEVEAAAVRRFERLELPLEARFRRLGRTPYQEAPWTFKRLQKQKLFQWHSSRSLLATPCPLQIISRSVQALVRMD